MAQPLPENPMYAIVKINGIQTRVTPDEVIFVPRLAGEVGASLTFEQVLLVGDGDRITVGKPFVQGAVATFEVLEHLRGPKLTRLRVTALTA
jgi:large subunit ribosomal protein L21